MKYLLLFIIPLLLAADAEPQSNVAVCGGDEVNCSDVKVYAGEKRHLVEALLHDNVGTLPAGVSDQFYEYLINATSSSSSMLVDGTPAIGETTKIDLPTTTGTGVSGECFQLDTPSTAYYVWFDTDNGSSDPAPAARTAIEVDVAAADDEETIATKLKDKLATLTSDFTDITKPNTDAVTWTNVANGPVTNATNCAPPDSVGATYSVIVEGRSSGTTVPFELGPHATKKKIVTQVRCFGGGNGIQFGKFLSQAFELEQGLLLTIKSNDLTFTLPAIKSTEDLKNIFAIPNTNEFSINIQAGSDQIIAIFNPVPFILYPTGTFGTDDYIKIEVRDDLSAGILNLDCAAIGFRQ